MSLHAGSRLAGDPTVTSVLASPADGASTVRPQASVVRRIADGEKQ
jgi:hypothetical protein